MSGYLLAPICFGLGMTYYALMRKDLQLQEQNRIEYAEYVSHILKDTENPSDEQKNSEGDGDGEKEKEEKEQVLGTGDQLNSHFNNDNKNIGNLEDVFNLKQRENTYRHDYDNDYSPNTNLHSRISAVRSKSLHNLNRPTKSMTSPSVEESVDDFFGFPLKSPKVSQDSLKPLSVSNTFLKTKLEHLIWEDRKDGLNKLKVLEEKREKEEVENVVSRILLKGKEPSLEKLSTCSKENSLTSKSTSSPSSGRKYSEHLRNRNNRLFTIPVSVTPWNPKLPTVYQTNIALIQYDLPLPSSLPSLQSQELKQRTSETDPGVVAQIKKLPPKPQIKYTCCSNLETNPPPLLPRCPTTRMKEPINNNNIIEYETCCEVYENFKYLDVDSSSIQTHVDEPVNPREIITIEKEKQENCSDLLKSDIIIIENPESCDKKCSNDTEIDNESETDRKTSSTITVIHNPSENSIDEVSNPSNSSTTDELLKTEENSEKEELVLKEDSLLSQAPEEEKQVEENTFCEINSPSSFETGTENYDNNDDIENLRNNYSQPDSTHFLFSPPNPTLKSDSVLSLCLQNPMMDSFSSSFMECSIENEVELDDNIISKNSNHEEVEDNENDITIISNNNNDNDTTMSLNKREEKSASSRLDYLHLHELCVKDILQELQSHSRMLSNSKLGIKRTQSFPNILNSKDFHPDWHTQKITENIGTSEQIYRHLVSFITQQWSSTSHCSAWLKIVIPSELLNQLKRNISHSKSVFVASVVIALLVIIFSWIMNRVSSPTVEKHGVKSSWHWWL